MVASCNGCDIARIGSGLCFLWADVYAKGFNAIQKEWELTLMQVQNLCATGKYKEQISLEMYELSSKM